jgi:hypothetical protein
MTQSLYKDSERLVCWLEERVIDDARGDSETTLAVEPEGKFWLGRLAPEELVAAQVGDRNERLEPCAIGIRVKLAEAGPWKFSIGVRTVAWLKDERVWTKTDEATVVIPVTVDAVEGTHAFGKTQLAEALEEVCRCKGLSAEIRCEVRRVQRDYELTTLLVNTSPAEHTDFKDTRLYECRIELTSLRTIPFTLEALPDSFRYDRAVFAYGVNCGVRRDGDKLQSTEVVTVTRARPIFWGGTHKIPDLRFSVLADDPLPSARELAAALKQWGEDEWSDAPLEKRATEESWSLEMRDEAQRAKTEFLNELGRIESGIALLKSNHQLLSAFKLMNKAMSRATAGEFDSWRPFQFGFLLANLRAVAGEDAEAQIVDIVWFATGGGKTETYLGLLITAALWDRLRGKQTGITGWSRFPLRMLSLQQLQRFADAFAAAEIVRQEAKISGDPFSIGFFVGQSSTPNSISAEPKPTDPWHVDEEGMPASLQVLDRCPFCRSDKIEMRFDRKLWKLEHRCSNGACPWKKESLPFYIVDDEIYRFLPTIVVGTLDKAALVSMQAAMRGFFAAPLGLCSVEGHGFTYSPRKKRPQGCLVPGCNSAAGKLPMQKELFAPTFRLQDELHLLKDSLGAVDAHYESLFDGLQFELTGSCPKILASSATLTGYERQTDVLYSRSARVFPHQPPKIGKGFWAVDSDLMMRRFAAIAPRGVTLEFAIDRTLSVLQTQIRRLASDTTAVCAEARVDEKHAAELLSLYGTNVVYGNTLRDLDAVMRSAETQLSVSGVNVESLTGKTQFEDVRRTTARLENPEPAFEDRLHVISASSMMSHGVDIDRLNVMLMLGIPLTTAEFIQATARVGRKHPGLVFVMLKIGRERDASVFRSFPQFVEQGDRFLEAIPITRRSRRVLEKTVAGLELARILAVHEPRAQKSLAMISALRAFLKDNPDTLRGDCGKLLEYLGFLSGGDFKLAADLQNWFERFGRNLSDPLPDQRFSNEASPSGRPMRSLRDVEEQVPVFLNRL